MVVVVGKILRFVVMAVGEEHFPRVVVVVVVSAEDLREVEVV